MKASFERGPLLTALQAVHNVVPNRSPKPILLSVKLAARKDGVSFIDATDMELGIRHKITGAAVDEPGEVMLPYYRFREILNVHDDETIQLQSDEDHVHLKTGRSKYKLLSQPAKEFPDIGIESIDTKTAAHCTMLSDDLKRMVQQTVYATDVESTRYALNGLLFELDTNQLKLVGTDGRRLAVATGSAKNVKKQKTDAPVVPSKACVVALKLASDTDEAHQDVEISLSENRATFTFDQATLTTRLVEGKFPRYKEVFPKDEAFELTVQVPSDELARTVRQAALVTNEETRGVDWTIGSGKIVMGAKAADVGESVAELPVSYESRLAKELDSGDKSLTITFDPRYVVQMLNTLPEGASVECKFVSNNSAALFQLEHLTYIVMPLTRDK